MANSWSLSFVLAMPILVLTLLDSSFSCYENYNIEMIDLGLKLAWGLEIIYYRTHNKNKKDAQLQYKQKQAHNSPVHLGLF